MSQGGGQRGGLLTKLGLKKKKLDSTDRAPGSPASKEADLSGTPRPRRWAEGSVASSSYYSDSGSARHSLSVLARPGLVITRNGLVLAEEPLKDRKVEVGRARFGRPHQDRPSSSRGASVAPPTPSVPLTPRAQRKMELTHEILFIQGSISRLEDEVKHRRSGKTVFPPKTPAEKEAAEERRQQRARGVWVDHTEPKPQHPLPVFQCMTSREVIRWLEARVRRLLEQLDQLLERYRVQFGEWKDSFDPRPIVYLGGAGTRIETTYNQLVPSQPGHRALNGEEGLLENRRPFGLDLAPSPGTPRPGETSSQQPPRQSSLQPRHSPALQATRRAARQEAPVPKIALNQGFTAGSLPDTPRLAAGADQSFDRQQWNLPVAVAACSISGRPVTQPAAMETPKVSETHERQRRLQRKILESQGKSEPEIERQWREIEGEKQEWGRREGERRARKNWQEGSRQEQDKPAPDSQSRERLKRIAQEDERQRLVAEGEEQRRERARLDAEIKRQRAIKERAAQLAATGAPRSGDRDRTSRHPRAARESSRSRSRDRHSSGTKGAASKANDGSSATHPLLEGTPPSATVSASAAGSEVRRQRHVAHSGSPRQQWLLNDVKTAFDITNEQLGITSDDTDEGLYHKHGTAVRLPRGVAVSREQESTAGDSVIGRRNSRSRLSRGSDPSSPSERDDASTASQFGLGVSPSASRHERLHGEERDQVGELPTRSRSQQRLTREMLAETTTSSTNSSMITYTGHPGSAPPASGIVHAR